MSSKTMFYILKRVLLALLTIWIVITITFFVMHSVPGGPFMSEKAISKEAQAALEEAKRIKAEAEAQLAKLANQGEAEKEGTEESSRSE